MSDAYWRAQRQARKPSKPPAKPYTCRRCGAASASQASHFPDKCDRSKLDMTTGEIDAFLGHTEPPRDRFGRPLIKTSDGKTKAYTRCTTFVGALEDTFNLGKWQQRMVALGLAMRDDLFLAAAALTAQDKTDLDKICDAAREAAAASAGATIGTALHKMCERLDRGEKFLVPQAAKPDIAAYQQATETITWQHVERLLVNDQLEVAGTPDRIGAPAGQRARVYDIKTGSIEFGLGKIAMQLAMYAHSVLYDADTGERQPLDVDTTTATIIHLPAGEGRCELVDIDITDAWEIGIRLCRDVREWRKRKSFPPAHGPDLAALIALCPDRDALLALRQQHLDLWSADHTELAKQRLVALDAA